MTGTRLPSPMVEAPAGYNPESYTLVVRNDGVSVRDFLLFLWRSRWMALVGAAICAGLAVTASLIATPRYAASVLVLPASDRDQSLGTLGSAVSELSGLASLAGLNAGAAGGIKVEALATLQSQVLTDQYVQQHNLLPVLFANRWDPNTGTWRPGVKVPTLWEANQLFQGIRAVDDNPKTGLVTVTIRWRNPYTASEWANGFVELTNDYLRQKAIDEAERSITYLNQEVARTNIVEVKNAIYALMETEIKKEMVAKGRRDFALRIIDPAVPPERKSFPRPLLWTAGGLAIGIFLGLLVSVLRETLVDETAERARHGPAAVPPKAESPARNPGIEQS